MSDSDRPTPIGEFHHSDTAVDLPRYDLERQSDEEERTTIYPGDGIFYWPEEETI